MGLSHCARLSGSVIPTFNSAMSQYKAPQLQRSTDPRIILHIAFRDICLDSCVCDPTLVGCISMKQVACCGTVRQVGGPDDSAGRNRATSKTMP